MFDPKKLHELLKLAARPLVSLGVLGGAVTSGIEWLRPILADYMDPAVAAPLAIFVPLVAASVCLWAAYRALAKKSKLLRRERFDLRVRSHEDLLGRDRDVDSLKALIDDSNLLLVDGESGSGKSSLVAFGLVPALKEDLSSVPILVSDYAGDWDNGLAKRIFDATWAALAADDRTKVGFAERPAIGTVDADAVRAILEGIGKQLGRMPILILDQFDDYQLAAREQFLGGYREWIEPTDLIARSRTWAVLRDLLSGGAARVVVVTRSDARAGLHSIKLINHDRSFTVRPLDAGWLLQWFAQVTADDGKGDVVANADAGWTDLKKQLQRDLTAQDMSQSTVLPQQVRIVFLGLRELPSLVLPEYRRAAAGAGVEALYIRKAIQTAAAASGLSQTDVRALLSAFVDSAQPRSLKTKALSLADLASIVSDTPKLQRALAHLKVEEVVRENPVSADKGSRWQLDHDYIARAVAAENRAANKLSLQLQDGAEAWRTAGYDIRQRYRSLLSLSEQLKLVWARRRGEFTYRPYRSYAAISTIRAWPVVLVLLLLAGAGWAWREETLRAAATQIADGLSADEAKGGPAVIALWGASPAVRSRVLDRLLNSPGRLRDAGTDWVVALTSVEPDAVRDLTSQLISRLDRKDLDPNAAPPLFDALKRVVERLDARGAAEASKDLRVRLDRKDVGPDTQQALLLALSFVGKKLDAHGAAETARDLHARLNRKDTDPSSQAVLTAALGEVGQRLDASDAAEIEKDLIARLDREDLNQDFQQLYLTNALMLLGERLEAPEADEMVKALIARLERMEANSGAQQWLITALGVVVERLDAHRAENLAKDLIARVDQEHLDKGAYETLVNALGAVAKRLDAPGAAEAAKHLRARLDRKDLDPNMQRSLIGVLGLISAQMDAPSAADLAAYLLARVDRKDVDQVFAITALSTVGERLDASSAAKTAKDLIAQLDRDEGDPFAPTSMIWALGKVGERLDEPSANETAKALLARLDRKYVDASAQLAMIGTLGTVGERLDTTGAAETARDLVARIDREHFESKTQPRLIDALGKVGERLDPRTAVETAMDLIARLDRRVVSSKRPATAFELARIVERLDAGGATGKDQRAKLDHEEVESGTQQALIDALRRVGVHLDGLGATQAAKDIIARLDRKEVDTEAEPFLINALGEVSVQLDAPGASWVTNDLIARLDRNGIDSETRRSLIDALGTLGMRLNAPSAAEAAKDLLARLDRKDIDPETQRSLVKVLGALGSQLDATSAAESAKHLLAHLDRDDVDPETLRSLIDALASTAVNSRSPATSVDVATIRAALGSIAWPLKRDGDSPAWARLEAISGEKFDHDIQHLLRWAQSRYKLAPTAARPPFGD